MIVLNTVSNDKIITGSGMDKKSIKNEMKKMEQHSLPLTSQMSRVNLGEKRKPIRFL